MNTYHRASQSLRTGDRYDQRTPVSQSRRRLMRHDANVDLCAGILKNIIICTGNDNLSYRVYVSFCQSGRQVEALVAASALQNATSIALGLPKIIPI